MIYEIARIKVKEGHEQQFEAAVAEATPLFKTAQGCVSLKLQRGIESPEEYQLIVGWQTLENHTIDFRESEKFQAWRALAGPHFSEPPRVIHINEVYTGF